LPPYPCPNGLDEITYLRELVEERSIRCYGRRLHERVIGAWTQVDHELGLIEQLGFAGYFLVVWDIVSFCRTRDIYCQGRGSAANSAVCYALRITNVDSVSLGLLFERFLSAERNNPPDIDLDIESDRREEVIQYIFERYGRSHTAQVANVITYRPRSAVRDMARALGYSTGQQDAWAKSLDRNSSLDLAVKNSEPLSSKTAFLEASDDQNNLPIRTQQNDGNESNNQIPIDVLRLASEIENSPRHLGIHSGGMVICDRPIVEVCPVEWGRMAKRSVLQWDKDDCAAVGLVKFDLLGLGMLSALHRSVDLIANAY
jgi:error-prone DNA polymerase